MKIYSCSKPNGDSTRVGVVLLSDNEAIYYISKFKFMTNDIEKAHCLGIKFALCHVRDSKLSSENEDIILFNNANKDKLINMLRNDETIKHFITDKSISYGIPEETTLVDKNMKIVAAQQVMFINNQMYRQ